ncbi:hypothetical protein AB837_00455 [bacterium AB1]|nr:hypothetical protein AB837_00455 [bacterium AB1]
MLNLFILQFIKFMPSVLQYIIILKEKVEKLKLTGFKNTLQIEDCIKLFYNDIQCDSNSTCAKIQTDVMFLLDSVVTSSLNIQKLLTNTECLSADQVVILKECNINFLSNALNSIKPFLTNLIIIQYKNEHNLHLLCAKCRTKNLLQDKAQGTTLSHRMIEMYQCITREKDVTPFSWQVYTLYKDTVLSEHVKEMHKIIFSLRDCVRYDSKDHVIQNVVFNSIIIINQILLHQYTLYKKILEINNQNIHQQFVDITLNMFSQIKLSLKSIIEYFQQDLYKLMIHCRKLGKEF